MSCQGIRRRERGGKGKAGRTGLQTPNKVPLDIPRQQLRLLCELLGVVLAEMPVVSDFIHAQDIGGRFEL